MKRIVISAVILAVMFVGCFYSVKVTCDFSDNLINRIHEVEDSYKNSDFERAKTCAQTLKDEWESFADRSILINDLGHAIEIASSIAEIQSFAEDEDDEIYASCDRAETQIDMFKDMQIPTIWKIL